MKIYLTVSFLIVVLLAACTSNPTYPVYNDNYYANIRTEFYTLNVGNWKTDAHSSIQWFQEFGLPKGQFDNFDYAGVMCYYLNQNDAWEALPSTRIFWTDNGVVYSDELWFSYNQDFLYIDYRNTIPGTALPPQNPIKIKAVYFDDKFYNSKAYKDIDWNDYNKVKAQLDLKD